ncbi:hypothetical protein [Virgisporangium aurantiacum]|uniref:Uncharacterized protein n=1 Tax=Virgisporangium aurantiacum TaxID=175570 RepID=A0A8J3Z7A6_9ACTN|nr:hypothetical protein [Virgisporangium aurantiacum]GIJ57712.1 hypothetical protein Vau01_052280 [Virgisporangium aurantiacum]
MPGRIAVRGRVRRVLVEGNRFVEGAIDEEVARHDVGQVTGVKS